MMIFPLKDKPDHEFSRLVRRHIEDSIATSDHRLKRNYVDFDPWSDPSIISFDLLVSGNEPVSFGALQQRSCFPDSTLRANTRHYLFPDFRTKQFARSSIGFSAAGEPFGGAIIRHQIRLSKNLGARGCFVSRDRGFRSFKFFMMNRVNALLTDASLHLEVISDKIFNTCGNPQAKSCWQYVAATSFSTRTVDELMCEMNFRRIQESENGRD
jgi:hypothetical protein